MTTSHLVGLNYIYTFFVAVLARVFVCRVEHGLEARRGLGKEDDVVRDADAICAKAVAEQDARASDVELQRADEVDVYHRVCKRCRGDALRVSLHTPSVRDSPSMRTTRL